MSALAWADALPLLEPERVFALAPLLVVAPHPDDETLGVGGLIALLSRRGLRVDVLLISDGAASHPGSPSHPPARLAALRRQEIEAALRALGVDPGEHLHSLDLSDGAIPAAHEDGFAAAAWRIRRLIEATGPAVVLLPWRDDPHPDHRATFALADAALAGLDRPSRRLEYPVWLLVRTEDGALPAPGAGFRIAIGDALPAKRRAIMAHVSQTTPLIDDAEESYCLTPETLAPFLRPVEVFIEQR